VLKDKNYGVFQVLLKDKELFF